MRESEAGFDRADIANAHGERCVRCGARVRLRKPAPGGAGAPPEATTSLCREPADALRSFGTRKDAKRGPAPHERHDGAPEGARVCALKLAQFAQVSGEAARLN